MTATKDAWIADYVSTLRSYVSEPAEAELEAAYDLGRRAVTQEWSVLEITEVHNEEVARLLAKARLPGQTAAIVQTAADVLMQCLAPFEMTARGFQEGIQALRRETIARGKQAEELARSNEDLERFAYATSHDLQEPLRTVVSFSQLLAQRYRGRLDSDADEFIGFVVDAAKRMSAMIDGLLDYSRVRRAPVGEGRVDCARVLSRALASLQVAVAESAAEITQDPLPTVQGNATVLQQLFQNLIGNAIKFRAQQPPRVHVAAERHHNEWLFSVRDNGIGIDPQYSERIFGAFQRLHTGREYAGAGLGLAVCRQIVHAHGGRLWVESALGQGATFYFSLPAAAPDQVAAA